MSFTVAPAHVLFKDEKLRKLHGGVVVRAGYEGRAWNEASGKFYGISLSPTQSSSPMHIGVAVSGVCTALVQEKEINDMYLGGRLGVDGDTGRLKKDASPNSVAIFLQKIGRDTAKVLLTHNTATPVDPAQVPTFGLTTGQGSAAKRLKLAQDDDGLKSIYDAIDEERS